MSGVRKTNVNYRRLPHQLRLGATVAFLGFLLAYGYVVDHWQLPFLWFAGGLWCAVFYGYHRLRLSNRSRSRRTLKWIGTLLTILAGLAVLVNGFRSLTWAPRSGAFYWFLEGGALGTSFAYPGTNFKPAFFMRLAPGWTNSNGHFAMGLFQQPVLIVSTNRVFVSTPIWLPVLMVVVPTASLWIRDRPLQRRGFCSNCGYDLTGNVSGTCPECGREATRA